jgi:hypothetical protein
MTIKRVEVKPPTPDMMSNINWTNQHDQICDEGRIADDTYTTCSLWLKQKHGCLYCEKVKWYEQNHEADKELAESIKSEMEGDQPKWKCPECGHESCSEDLDDPDTLVCDGCGEEVK